MAKLSSALGAVVPIALVVAPPAFGSGASIDLMFMSFCKPMKVPFWLALTELERFLPLLPLASEADSCLRRF